MYYIERGIYRVDRLREIALVQYDSQCEFIPIDSVLGESNMSCSEEKRDFADRECFALKEKELNLNYRIN